MAGGDRPTLIRIPFSHFCRKAEWGLTQAGIPYDTLDVSLRGMLQIDRISGQGTVPILLDGGRFVEGSDTILTWAAERADEGTDPLYPEALRAQVQEWELWAGEAVGPVARREAYRVAYNDPRHFTTKRMWRMAARLGHNQILGVLKFYKTRRYDDHDKATVPVIVANVADELERQGTGYLVGDRRTAADIAVAALMEPFLYAAPGRDYAALPGWGVIPDFVARVKPAKTLRRHRRLMTEKQWRRLEALRPRDEPRAEEEEASVPRA